jgi:hypothetical protein
MKSFSRNTNTTDPRQPWADEIESIPPTANGSGRKHDLGDIISGVRKHKAVMGALSIGAELWLLLSRYPYRANH